MGTRMKGVKQFLEEAFHGTWENKSFSLFICMFMSPKFKLLHLHLYGAMKMF
jgi:hypothetical protein